MAWFRAESAASIATDMRKLAFDLGIIQDGHRTAARVTGTPARVGGDDGDTGGMGCGNDPGLSLVAKGEGVTDTAKDLEEYDDVYIINELMRRLGLCRCVIAIHFLYTFIRSFTHDLFCFVLLCTVSDISFLSLDLNGSSFLIIWMTPVSFLPTCREGWVEDRVSGAVMWW